MVQYVLDLNDAVSTAAIVSSLCGHVAALAVQKFSSNVIEKCVAMGSRVTDCHGLSAPIEQVTAQHAPLLCGDGKDGLAVAEASCLLSRGEKAVVELELQDGRRLSCTADHLVMTAEGWSRVAQLELGRTRLLVGPDAVDDERDERELGCSLALTACTRLSMKNDRPRCLALMRLAGCSCGQRGQRQQRSITVRHAHDLLCLTRDLCSLGQDEPAVANTSTGDWEVRQAALSSSRLVRLITRLLRDDCAAALRREFLAGLCGACGSVELSSGVLALALPPAAAVLRPLLPALLRLFGLVCECDASSLSLPPSTLLRFASSIGCRYNVELSYRLSALACYARCALSSSPPLSFSSFAAESGCADWFQPASSAFSVSSLPTFRLMVVAVRPAQPQPVFDLTVQHLSHSFLANGILVHKSDTALQLKQPLPLPPCCRLLTALLLPAGAARLVLSCLELASEKLRGRLVEELSNAERLPRLLQDPYANYCLQKALSVSKKQQLERLVHAIRPHLHQLRHTAFGKVHAAQAAGSSCGCAFAFARS